MGKREEERGSSRDKLRRSARLNYSARDPDTPKCLRCVMIGVKRKLIQRAMRSVKLLCATSDIVYNTGITESNIHFVRMSIA